MWLVPLLPFLAFFVILFFGEETARQGSLRRHRTQSASAFVLSLARLHRARRRTGRRSRSRWTWFQLGQAGSRARVRDEVSISSPG